MGEGWFQPETGAQTAAALFGGYAFREAQPGVALGSVVDCQANLPKQSRLFALVTVWPACSWTSPQQRAHSASPHDGVPPPDGAP